jgi:uncharacterized protein
VSESRLPSRTEALGFLTKAGCSRSVIDHCKTVSNFAVSVARSLQSKGINVDIQLVEIGGLLHDVGRSRTHTVNHGMVGGEIARSLRLPSSLVRVIERHVGGGVPREEAVRLGWPAKDYLPVSWEEKIVCYADKRVEGLGTVSIEQALKTYAASLGENHPALGRILKLHREIVAVVGPL